jgi:hypothetical protein
LPIVLINSPSTGSWEGLILTTEWKQTLTRRIHG